MQVLLRNALLFVALGFVVYAGWQLARRWDASRVTIRYLPLFLAPLPVVVALVTQGVGWIVLVERMGGSRLSRLGALALYLDSQLARYTPGKVGLPLIRMAGAENVGTTRTLVAASILVEVGAFTATGVSISLLLLYLAGPDGLAILGRLGHFTTPALLLSTTGMVLVASVDRRFLPRWIRRFFGPGSGSLLPWGVLLVLAAYWALWGVHGWLLSLAFGGDSRHACLSAAATIAAPLVGFFALVAPAGAGVREAVFSLALAPVLGAAPALCVALASRGISVGADFAVWALARGALRVSSKRPGAESTAS